MKGMYWAEVMWLDPWSGERTCDRTGPFTSPDAAQEQVLALVEAYAHLLAGQPFAAYVVAASQEQARAVAAVGA